MESAFPRIQVNGMASFRSLVTVALAVLLGMSAGYFATTFMPQRYGYRGMIEIPLFEHDMAVRPSAAKNFLLVHGKTLDGPDGSLRTVYYENDGNRLLELTSYGSSLDQAKAMLEKCRAALAETFGKRLEQSQKQTEEGLASATQERKAIEIELADLQKASSKAGFADWVRQDREFRLRELLRAQKEKEKFFESRRATSEREMFRFVDLAPLSSTPISPNVGKWLAFGGFLGFFLSLLFLFVRSNIGFSWR